MTFFTNLGIQWKFVAVIIGLMAMLTISLGYASYTSVRDVYYERIHDENRAGMRAVIYTVRRSHDRLTYIPDENNGVERLTWDRMPDTLLFDDVDNALSISGLDPTVFHLDQTTRDFMRIATTLRNENGRRQVATPLTRNVAYNALINGEKYIGEISVLGAEYLAIYVPVFNASGAVVGAFAVVRPLADVQSSLTQHMMLKLLVACGFLIVAFVFASFVVRRMLTPFADLTSSIVEMSNDNLDVEIGHTGRQDEVGKMAQGLTVLKEAMRQAADLKEAEAHRTEKEAEKQLEQSIVVEALTDGLARLGQLDLTVQIESTPSAPFPADYEGLRSSFNMLVDSLSESLDAIRDVADEVRTDAQELASSSSDLSGRTEGQAATLEQSAAALEQLSASVQSTADNAGDAEETTSENRNAALRAAEVVESAIEAMASIEESSQKITQIISVIEDIAFQTNLLALNAGVEAARAGEAGRGFAVVASEVRALAQHSSASAQEIKDLIASSSGHVENGSKLVRRAGESLGDITDRVARVASLVSDIAVSAKEQSIGVTEINTGVRNLDAATQRNAAMAEEASAASEGLTNAADRLAEQLDRFRLSNASTKQNWRPSTTHSPSVKAEVADAQAAFGTFPQGQVAVHSNAQARTDVFKDF